MQVFKIEIVMSRRQCRLTNILIDGMKWPASYQIAYYPTGDTTPYPVVKVGVVLDGERGRPRMPGLAARSGGTGGLAIRCQGRAAS
eukprot:336292-Chlamydomonas_euryale.AAC.2